MELTKYSRAIKAELEMELQKVGSSLQDFEEALRNINTGEGVFKVAKDASSIFSNPFTGAAEGVVSGGLGLLKSAPELAGKVFAGAGGLAGLTIDDMDQSVEALNKDIKREREKIELVKRITENLKREHGLI